MTTADRTFDFTSTRGSRPWRVKLLLPGDAYGRNDCLTADRPLVEFWDREHAGEPYRDQSGAWPDDGQFVSRYWLETMLEHRRHGMGLDLMGYEPAWKISAADFDKVAAWLIPLTAKLAGGAR